MALLIRSSDTGIALPSDEVFGTFAIGFCPAIKYVKLSHSYEAPGTHFTRRRCCHDFGGWDRFVVEAWAEGRRGPDSPRFGFAEWIAHSIRTGYIRSDARCVDFKDGRVVESRPSVARAFATGD